MKAEAVLRLVKKTQPYTKQHSLKAFMAAQPQLCPHKKLGLCVSSLSCQKHQDQCSSSVIHLCHLIQRTEHADR